MNIRPQADEFLAYAVDHSVVPVWTEVLGDLETPVSAFLKLVDDGPGFLLESVENGERWSRFSFMAAIRLPHWYFEVRRSTLKEPSAQWCRPMRGSLGR